MRTMAIIKVFSITNAMDQKAGPIPPELPEQKRFVYNWNLMDKDGEMGVAVRLNDDTIPVVAPGNPGLLEAFLHVYSKASETGAYGIGSTAYKIHSRLNKEDRELLNLKKITGEI